MRQNKKEDFVSKYCVGEKCHCGNPATKKIQEVIFDDEPPELQMRHPYTQYVCGECFDKLLRPYLNIK